MAKLNLDGIGTAADLFTTKVNSPLAQFLIDWLNERIVDMKGELAEDGRTATGSLSQSFAVESDGTAKAIGLELLANDYWDFINSGVDGTERAWGSPYSFKTDKPSKGMVESMKESQWVAAKGLQPNDGQTFESMLYAISVSVKRQGIEPSHFMDTVFTPEAITSLEEDLASQFEAALLNLTFPE